MSFYGNLSPSFNAYVYRLHCFSLTGCKTRPQCGQFLAIRLDPWTDRLLALDSYRGLFSVDTLTGDVQLLYNSRTPVAGRRPVLLNDFVVSEKDGTIIMSDSSDTFNIDNDIYIPLEGRKDGRLIALSREGRTKVFPLALSFPNGLEFTDDESALLVVETGFSRVKRISLSKAPGQWLRVSNWAVNLPGFPDQIRRSDHGTFWVGMYRARHASVRNPLQEVVDMTPAMRSFAVGWVSKANIESRFGRWGMAVEFDGLGRVLRSL